MASQVWKPYSPKTVSELSRRCLYVVPMYTTSHMVLTSGGSHAKRGQPLTWYSPEVETINTVLTSGGSHAKKGQPLAWYSPEVETIDMVLTRSGNH